MKTLKDIEYLDGVKVFLRVDFNVPIKNGSVFDDFRIKAAFPTIQFLLEKGAVVILASHLESKDKTNPSLEPVAMKLKELGVTAKFIKNYREASSFIEGGDKCFLLENLRFYPEEKANDDSFAKQLASLADIYVNDAFSVCHREHASIVGLPKYLPSYAGLQLEREVSNLSKAFKPPHPFIFILGGAKFETKLPLLNKFLGIADKIFVGGALANDLLKAKGLQVGKSLLSSETVDLGPIISNNKVLLPLDILNENREAVAVEDIKSDDKNVDMGPKTVSILREEISKAKFILWNGPLGLYEDGYQESTRELAKTIAEATSKGVESIVGGGDTLAAIASLGIEDKFTFISTAGGAMLDFLAKGTLAGIESLGG